MPWRIEGSKELGLAVMRLTINPMRFLNTMFFVAASAGCAVAQTTPGAPAPLHVGPVTRFQDRAISESSGLVASRSQPGLLWTHNDGGNGPLLFASDTLARRRGRFLVKGTVNRDWEDIAAGPCAGEGFCLYLGDTGDNRKVHRISRVLRFPEPNPASLAEDSVGIIDDVEMLVYRYPRGPVDVEAMYADEAGNVYLITKGGSDPVDIYRVEAAAWKSSDTATAEFLGPFPIQPGSSRLAGVTGADLSSDGRRLVVRTYRELFFYLVDDTGGVGSGPVATCPILGLEPQGEGVAWLDADRVALSSEAGMLGQGSIAVVQCLLPWTDTP